MSSGSTRGRQGSRKATIYRDLGVSLLELCRHLIDQLLATALHLKAQAVDGLTLYVDCRPEQGANCWRA